MAGAQEDKILEVNITGTEKRRDGGKHYVYRMSVVFASGRVDYVCRRYSQFDALRETMAGILGPMITLPKLTSKKYIGRSSVHQVAEYRTPKLQRFISQLLTFNDNKVLTKTLQFFLTPTAEDARLETLPEGGSEEEEEETVALAEALWDYMAREDDELTIYEGDRIAILRRVDEEWMEGRLNDKVGFFPVNYVKVLEETSPVTVSSKTPSRAMSSTANDTRSQAHKPRTPGEELRSTEQTYVANLREVREKFFPKMRHCITAGEAKTLFNNWAELIPCSEQLAEALKDSGRSEADVLSELLPRLEGAYAKYCAGIPAAQAMYEKKLAEKDFVDFETSFANLNKPTLNHIMRPVQRIMKYPLLISELLKDDQLSSSDRTKLQDAMEAATELAVRANHSMSAPRKTLDKLDISGPDTGTFQHVVGVRGEGQAAEGGPAGQGAVLPPFLLSDHHALVDQPKKKSSFPNMLRRHNKTSGSQRQSADDRNSVIGVTAGISFDGDEDEESERGHAVEAVVSLPLGRKERSTNLLPATMRNLPPAPAPAGKMLKVQLAPTIPGPSRAISVPSLPLSGGAMLPPTMLRPPMTGPAAARPPPPGKAPPLAPSVCQMQTGKDGASHEETVYSTPPKTGLQSPAGFNPASGANQPKAPKASTSVADPQPAAEVFNVRLRAVAMPAGPKTDEANAALAKFKVPLLPKSALTPPIRPKATLPPSKPSSPSLSAEVGSVEPVSVKSALPCPGSAAVGTSPAAVLAAKPSVAKAPPVVAVAKPTMTTAKPMCKSVKPAITAAKPAVAVAKPAVTTTKPAVAAAKPALTTTKPTVTAAKPIVTLTKPTVTAAKPIVTSTKPTVTAAKPTIAATKPTVTAAKPTVAAAKPTIAPTKPLATVSKPVFGLSMPELATPAHNMGTPGFPRTAAHQKSLRPTTLGEAAQSEAAGTGGGHAEKDKSNQTSFSVPSKPASGPKPAPVAAAPVLPPSVLARAAARPPGSEEEEEEGDDDDWD